ncbi:hypothetical protein EGW08_015268 [Elysia chlorotica]|uniref:Amino acid permease/ SLC12A domain-containing protein n=1 Tax=Elysia chlorotica TaxID=188477 RepID=A0A433T621_ELYCH|nr:hypothetical protein EGW08_015268 [Elysia chlorotica]
MTTNIQKNNGSLNQNIQECVADSATCAQIEVQQTKLQRSLSLSNVVALLLSTTGHVAIFITPSIILRLAGSLSSCMILLCLGSLGVYTMALCFTEMATTFQKAGGPYLYVTESLGKLPGFLIAYGYIALISGPFLAFISQTAALYIITAFVIDADCDSGEYKVATKILAGWILLTLTFLNCSFFKVVVKVQSFLTLMRLVAIGIIIISGLHFTLTNSVDNFDTPFKGTHFHPGSLSLAFIYITFSLGGCWKTCILLTNLLLVMVLKQVHVLTVFRIGQITTLTQELRVHDMTKVAILSKF